MSDVGGLPFVLDEELRVFEPAKELARLLNIAESSLGEVEYLLMRSRDLDLATADVAQPLLSGSVRNLLNAPLAEASRGGRC